MSVFYAKSDKQWRILKHLYFLGISRKAVTINDKTGHVSINNYKVADSIDGFLDFLRTQEKQRNDAR